MLDRWTCVLTASEVWFDECIPAVGTRAWSRSTRETSSMGAAGTFAEVGDEGGERDAGGRGRGVLLVGYVNRSDRGIPLAWRH